MKNLLIYTGPNKKFNKENEILIKIQIDNSLDLGWKKENLIIATDFPYEYKGVKSILLPEGLYYDFDLRAGKIPPIIYLLGKKILNENELYWCHDLDAFELNRINESELGLTNLELGLTHYIYKPEWQCGSFFFRSSAKDIFKLIDKTTRLRPHLSRNNEKTLTKLINDNAINSVRYKKMNVTYNIMKKYLGTIYSKAEKPLKVIHFSPWDKDVTMPDTTLNMFMYGKNSLKIPLMNKRIIKIFNKYGIK